MNLSLYLAFIFVITFVLGRFLEKIRIPWVFAALFLGLILSFKNPFAVATASPTFDFLAQLGMYFLLFIIGFDLNVKEIISQKKTVAKLSAIIILTGAILGSILVHYIFNIPWYISILVGTSFSTVGEAILIPILDEFKVVHTRFGQTILGIGTIDDIVELITIIALALILGDKNDRTIHAFFMNLIFMAVLFMIPFFVSLIHKKIHSFQFKNIPSLFLFSLFMMFLLVGIGNYVDAAALGALLAGITLKVFLTEDQAQHIESTVRIISYGFFVPIFFTWVGQSVDVMYILKNPLIVILLVLVTAAANFIMYLNAKKQFGKHQSILMGIGLSVKFSTSVVILSLLFYKGIIPGTLYSAMIGAMTVSQFVVPILFSYFLKKWRQEFNV